MSKTNSALAALAASFLFALAAGHASAAPQDTSTSNTASTATSEQSAKLETVIVTGSNIPRAQIDGPSPVVTITSADIERDGFVTAADIMTSLTQNLGATDNNQFGNGFTPGAQAVDLRGLGPNHTLILVNGRRVADYPQSYGGSSNFTDISNIPVSMIDRVEVLSGSASAIYGSDAISGVVNYILKKKADGTTIDLRFGDTQHGGAGSQDLSISTGFSHGNFDAVVGIDLYNQRPLWGYQRSYTDSRLDAPPGTTARYPSFNFGIFDEDDNFIDPGKATCDALSHLDHGTIAYAYRPNYGNYCGSTADVGYGTFQNERKMATLYGSATYKLNDNTEFFVDLQAGTSHQESYYAPLGWAYSYPLNGDTIDTPFINAAANNAIQSWERQYFTIDETGGFNPGMIRNIGNTLTVTGGFKGTFGDSNWNYQAWFSHSQNKLEYSRPVVIADKANAFFLGSSLGVDPDTGYDIFNAPMSRLYTPLTPAEYSSITTRSIDNDQARAENWSVIINNTELFNLPAGPVGFAASAEYGNQYFSQNPDPLSLNGTYYDVRNTVAVGSRSHEGAGFEFRIPILSQLTATAAGRYDRYEYSSDSAKKFTYSLGLEYRPLDSLLLRASYATGFRAPDLSYLYEGLSGSSSNGTDYWLCHEREPNVAIGDCDYNDISYDGRSVGNLKLKNETSKSLTYGFVYSPTQDLDFSADYYIIKLSNEVEFQDSDDVLRYENQCRSGELDINSSYCQQILSQVVRNPDTAANNPGEVTSVLVLPINAATDRTSGLDLNAHYRLRTDRIGDFNFKAGLTYVSTHTIQLTTDTPVINEFVDMYDYLIPRTKATFSVTWSLKDFSTTLYGSRLGGLPNYDGDKRLSPTYRFNWEADYQFSSNLSASITVNNLLDKKPQLGDPTWTSYPYYDRRWFSPLGRAFYAQVRYTFGRAERQ